MWVFIKGNTEVRKLRCKFQKKYPWRTLILVKPYNLNLRLYYIRTLSLVFSCKISKSFQKSFFTERLWAAASESSMCKFLENSCSEIISIIPSKYINVESTLKQRWLSTLIDYRWFNIDIGLKMKVEPTYIYWHCFNVKMSLSFLR